MLTKTELDKLLDPRPVRDKSNDFIVRRKFKKWMDDANDVSGYILQYLPSNQRKKLITRDHILCIMNVLFQMLSITTEPIIETRKNECVAIRPHSAPRQATQEEVLLRDDTKEMVHALFGLLSNEDARNVIQTELAQHQPEYILAKQA